MDLSEGEFIEYDEKGECPVGISNLKASFKVVILNCNTICILHYTLIEVNVFANPRLWIWWDFLFQVKKHERAGKTIFVWHPCHYIWNQENTRCWKSWLLLFGVASLFSTRSYESNRGSCIDLSTFACKCMYVKDSTAPFWPCAPNWLLLCGHCMTSNIALMVLTNKQTNKHAQTFIVARIIVSFRVKFPFCSSSFWLFFVFFS